MKVTAIKDYKRKADDKPYWRVELEGSEIPLLMFSKPEFAEGTEVDVGNLKASKDGKYYTLIKPKEDRPRYAKTDDDIIMLQVAFKGAVELDGIWYVPDGQEHNKRVLDNTAELYAGLLLLKPKKGE